MRLRIRIAALFLEVLVAGAMFGQVTTGTLLGTIHDPSGAPVSSAKVTATETGTGHVHQAFSDASGVYTLPLLPIGSYEISAEITGFKRAKQSEVVLHLAENLKVDFTLELGAVTESVEVSGTYTRVNTEDASLSALLGAKDMQAIPVNPMNGNSAVVNGTVATGQSAAPNGFTASGFVYDYNSGNGTGLIYGTDSTGTTIAGGISNSVFIAY